jgi:hypothetical protein
MWWISVIGNLFVSVVVERADVDCDAIAVDFDSGNISYFCLA